MQDYAAEPPAQAQRYPSHQPQHKHAAPFRPAGPLVIGQSPRRGGGVWPPWPGCGALGNALGGACGAAPGAGMLGGIKGLAAGVAGSVGTSGFRVGD